MNENQQTLDTLKDIKSMMDRSSRFISLSGLSGVAAGICALVGAWVANTIVGNNNAKGKFDYQQAERDGGLSVLEGTGYALLVLAIITFFSATILAFFFTWLRSRKTGVKLIGPVSVRLTLAVVIPIFIGFLFILKLVQFGTYELIAPACLLFYGLGLLNGSRYTTNEIRYLAYAVLAVGIFNLFFLGYGLYCWALGFGVLHFVYGIIMWNKYERNKSQ